MALYGIMAAAGFGMSFMDKNKDDNIPMWDWTRDYYLFPPEFTGLIDEILSSYERGVVTQKTLVGEGKNRPAIGYHYFYNENKANRGFIANNFQYITFEKKEKKVDNEIIYYYRCYVGGMTMGKQQEILKYVVAKLFTTSSNRIRTISIDTSGANAKTIYTTVKYSPAKDFQKNVVDWIINKYENDKNKNVKVIISATRGTGKSFLARALKREYEKKHTAHFVKLFGDFDPTNIGVNIKSLVLNEADVNCPVVILMDEIDVIYKDTLRTKNTFDPRTLHTRNKMTFNAMMDAIGDTPNVIMIGTTELSPEELYKEEKYHSYMRPGRIDHFIKLDRNIQKIKKLTHKDIEGYPNDQPEAL